jgi:PilZ domain
VTALDNETQIAAHTEDLSLFGCFVETTTPFVNETKVRVRISHDGMIFAAEGTVVYARERAGMGISFTSIEPSGVSILEDWLAELAR